MNVIYERNGFKVYHADNCYILHNSNLEGFRHTHLDSIKQAKLLIELSLKQKVPHNLPRYLLISLSRINPDSDYKSKIDLLIENKKKKPEYKNISKNKGW